MSVPEQLTPLSHQPPTLTSSSPQLSEIDIRLLNHFWPTAGSRPPRKEEGLMSDISTQHLLLTNL